MTQTSKPRIALIGQYGGGNLGDGAIWESLLAAIRLRLPDSDIVAFTCNWQDTQTRHEVEAHGLRWTESNDNTSADAEASPSNQTQESKPNRTGSALRKVIGTMTPGLRQRWWDTRAVFLNEHQHRRNERFVPALDLIIIAGSGQFSSLFGGPLTHPMALWRWGRMARRAQVRYVMLSVGAGVLRGPARLLVRRAIALADYVSFRDTRSREYVGGTSALGASVVPDLAYALPLVDVPPLLTLPPSRAIVGISPMAYADPRFYPSPNPAAYRRHLESLTELSLRLLEQGHEIVLFTTDAPDELAQEELLNLISSKNARATLRVTHASTVHELTQVLSQVDVVISARLHGVLLAHVMGRPALAIAHERKVTTLMEEMGHSRFCQPIDSFNTDDGWQQVLEIIDTREQLSRDIRERSASNRLRVENQYDQILGRDRD